MVLLLCAILIPAGEFTMGRTKPTPDDKTTIGFFLISPPVLTAWSYRRPRSIRQASASQARSHPTEQ